MREIRAGKSFLEPGMVIKTGKWLLEPGNEKKRISSNNNMTIMASAYLCVLEVILPQGANLVLPSDVPDGEGQIAVRHLLHVETCKNLLEIGVKTTTDVYTGSVSI